MNKIIDNKNYKKEFYLTDLVEIFDKENYKVSNFNCKLGESMGVNDKEDLAKLEKQFQEDMRKKFLKKGVKNILITLGSKGVYFSNGTESHFVDAHKLKDDVKDTTGAGDAFNGAFSVALAKSLKIVDALEFSNKVAGISTTKEGAANSMPSINEVENY